MIVYLPSSLIHGGILSTGPLILHVREYVQFFATASDDGSVRVWDSNRVEGRGVTNLSRMAYKGLKSRVAALAVCAGADSLVAAGHNGQLHVLNVEVAKKRVTCTAQRSIDLAADGRIIDVQTLEPGSATVVYTTVRGAVYGWDMRADTLAFALRNPPSQGLVEAFSIGERASWMMVGTSRGIYTVWDMRYQLPVKSWVDPKGLRVGRIVPYPTGAPDLSGKNGDTSSWVRTPVS